MYVRGVRQGCPLSPLLFILAMELLAVKIRQDPDYRGISLPDGQEVKISQFADDTTIITENVESLKPHLQILDRFGSISGLKLNKKKTKAMLMGSMKDRNLKVLYFKTTKEPIKVLGVHLSYNTYKCTEENVHAKIKKMKTKLNLWLSRDLMYDIWQVFIGESFRYITVSLCSIHADCFRIDYQNCSGESLCLSMKKQERQDKKSSYVSTSRKRGNQFC